MLFGSQNVSGPQEYTGEVLPLITLEQVPGGKYPRLEHGRFPVSTVVARGVQGIDCSSCC